MERQSVAEAESWADKTQLRSPEPAPEQKFCPDPVRSRGAGELRGPARIRAAPRLHLGTLIKMEKKKKSKIKKNQKTPCYLKAKHLLPNVARYLCSDLPKLAADTWLFFLFFFSLLFQSAHPLIRL